MQLPRFYPILDTQLLEARGFDAVHAAAALLDAGVRLMQFRHKTQFTRARFEEARLIARLSREAEAILVINDRADIALLLDAGLHVGQDDLSPPDARAVLGNFRMLGFSTHNEPQLRDALHQPVDYIAFGPVFGTSSKANADPAVGLEQLRAASGLTTLPLVAIGGITRSNASPVLAGGAASVAVIADLYPSPLTPDSLKERAREWLSVTNSGEC